MNKNFLLATLLTFMFFSAVTLTNTAFASDAHGLSPNGMTVQQSRQIAEQKEIGLIVAVGLVMTGAILAILRFRKKKTISKNKQIRKK